MRPPLERASNFVLLSFPQRGDSVMVERLQSGRRGVCDAALLCNAGPWTAARPAPARLLGGGGADNQLVYREGAEFSREFEDGANVNLNRIARAFAVFFLSSLFNPSPLLFPALCRVFNLSSR